MQQKLQAMCDDVAKLKEHCQNGPKIVQTLQRKVKKANSEEQSLLKQIQVAKQSKMRTEVLKYKARIQQIEKELGRKNKIGLVEEKNSLMLKISYVESKYQ